MIYKREYCGFMFAYSSTKGKLWRKEIGGWLEVAVGETAKKGTYPCVYGPSGSRKKLFNHRAHRFVWLMVHGEFPPDEMWVDHINGDTTDYRLANLRLVTPTENHQNRSKASNNKSGIIGVSRNTKSRAWIAQIKVGDRVIHLGSFKTKKEAGMARFAAELEHGFHINHGRKPTKK